MPWMLPEGLVSGVFMSVWASHQKHAQFLVLFAQAPAMPAMVPMAWEWSPPSTSGNSPLAMVASTVVGQVAAYFADHAEKARILRLPISADSMETWPMLCMPTTSWPIFFQRRHHAGHVHGGRAHVGAAPPAPRSRCTLVMRIFFDMTSQTGAVSRCCNAQNCNMSASMFAEHMFHID